MYVNDQALKLCNKCNTNLFDLGTIHHGYPASTAPSPHLQRFLCRQRHIRHLTSRQFQPVDRVAATWRAFSAVARGLTPQLPVAPQPLRPLHATLSPANSRLSQPVGRPGKLFICLVLQVKTIMIIDHDKQNFPFNF